MENNKNNNFISKLNGVSKLNKITIFLIILLYSALVFTIGALLNKTPNYNVDLNGKTIYGENANVATIIMSKNNVSEKEDGTLEYTTSNYMYSIIDTKGDAVYNNATLSMALRTKKDNNVFLNISEQSKLPAKRFGMNYSKIDSSFSYSTDSHSVLKSEGIKSIYGQLKYTDDKNQPVSYEYKRDILELTKKDIQNASYDNKLSTLFTSEFMITGKVTNTDSYYYSFEINLEDLKANYKLDAQVFIETDDKTILPLCGIYNYANDSIHAKTAGTSGNQIVWDLEPRAIYIKVNYYTSDKDCQSTVIKMNYKNIVDNYKK